MHEPWIWWGGWWFAVGMLLACGAPQSHSQAQPADYAAPQSGLMFARAEPMQRLPGSRDWIGVSGGGSGVGVGGGGIGGGIGITTAADGIGAGGDLGTLRPSGGAIGIGRTPLTSMRPEHRTR